LSGQLKTYGFINAKIRARLGKLLSQEQFTSLMKCSSIEEVIASLKTSEYEEHLNHYARTGDVRAVEFALFVHEIETVHGLLKHLTGASVEFVRVLILRYEVDLVKNALRFWFDRNIRGRTTEGNAYIYSERLVHDVDMDGIMNARDNDQLLEALEGTPYFEMVRRNIDMVRTDKNIFGLELELDSYFYKRLFEQIKKLSRTDRAVAERIIRVEVDLQNIDRIVRFVSFYGNETRSRYSVFLPGGSIDSTVLREAYIQTGAEEALSVLLSNSYTSYKAFTGEHHSNPYARLHLVEGLLRQILNDELDRLLRGYPFTIGTVIAYVFLKRREIETLIRVINSKYYGMSEDKIREVL